MIDIKEGALVKVWDDDEKKYVIGRLEGRCGTLYVIEDGECFYVHNCFYNAVEIPPELAKQLEDLGK